MIEKLKLTRNKKLGITTRTDRSMTGTREWEYIKYPKPIVSLKNFFANKNINNSHKIFNLKIFGANS